jgi:hypothetical protein
LSKMEKRAGMRFAADGGRGGNLQVAGDQSRAESHRVSNDPAIVNIPPGRQFLDVNGNVARSAQSKSLSVKAARAGKAPNNEIPSASFGRAGVTCSGDKRVGLIRRRAPRAARQPALFKRLMVNQGARDWWQEQPQGVDDGAERRWGISDLAAL